MPREVLLTFDIEGPPGREDFMDFYSLRSLRKVLELMEKYRLHGLFFVTGNVIETICKNQEVFDLLSKQEIGFHSSSHSVKPRIPEYTDLPDYDTAMKRATNRESSRVDPFTGEIVSEGGLTLLKEAFPDKDVRAFKAPFDYFSPPHTEALRELGFEFGFSCDLHYERIFYKGLTFYPRTIYIDGVSKKFLQIEKLNRPPFVSPFFSEMAGTESVVLGLHPSHLLFGSENLGFTYRNPMHPFRLRRKDAFKVSADLSSLELLLSKISLFERLGILESSPDLSGSRTLAKPIEAHVKRNRQYCLSISSGLFGYKPKFLLHHFRHFLEDVA